MIDEFLKSAAAGAGERAEIRVSDYSPLILAYLGDAVYDLYIRTGIAHENVGSSVHGLHKKSIKYVNCKAQSEVVQKISPDLTDEEKDVVRRGRNAKSGTIPKNAGVTEYKYATGFEALLGYLYLKKDFTRLAEILDKAKEIVQE